ncbi:MAG: hypothetical protein ABFD54_06050 [Armatimonadota bacterium]|nr:hypothetical protein [bacterium]
MAKGVQGEVSPAVAAIVIILAIAIAGGVMYYMANKPAATPVSDTSAIPPPVSSGQGAGQGAGSSNPAAPASPAAPAPPAPQPGGR